MGYRLSKIYTRTGDQGETGLADGSRVAKDHPRIEAIGTVDELNSHLGLLLASLVQHREATPSLQEVIDLLQPCQHRLFDLGGELAMPGYQALADSDVLQLEQWIDTWNQGLPALREFILPGGSVLAAQAHICRSIARRAERRCQSLHQQEPLRAVCLAYLNRLSDLLFVMARVIIRQQQLPEVFWQPATRQSE